MRRPLSIRLAIFGPTLLGSTLHGLLALAGALALLGHTTFAQTWQTVDDFQYA